jgi:drug/metabolite transporter (DMT)-like permease
LTVGLAGALLVIINAGDVSFGGDHVLGSVCAFVSAAGWAWYGVIVGRVVKVIGSPAATGWTMAAAAGILFPFSLGELATHDWVNVSWVGWAALLYGSIAGPVIAMSLWGRALHELGTRQTMVYTYLEPVTAVIIAALLLGEAFGPGQAIGAILAFAGVWLTGASQRKTGAR